MTYIGALWGIFLAAVFACIIWSIGLTIPPLFSIAKELFAPHFKPLKAAWKCEDKTVSSLAVAAVKAFEPVEEDEDDGD